MADTLAGLRPGEGAAVLRVSSGLAKSLSRLGLTPGTEIVCLRRLPLGDPAVYRWRGIEVALRRRDAAGIQIEIRDAQKPPLGAGELCPRLDASTKPRKPRGDCFMEEWK